MSARDRRRAAKVARRRKRQREGVPVDHGRRGAIVIGDTGRIVQVNNEDGTLCLFHADAPQEPTESDCLLACLHCMKERHPEIKVALGLARRHRVVLYDGECWRPCDG